MALTYVNLGMDYFGDPTKGRPVFNGSVWIGEPDLDPEVLGNRKNITLRQEDGTEVPILPAGQPINTGPGGYILYNGSPVQVLTDGNYSIKVRDSQGVQKFYVENAFDGIPVTEDGVFLKVDTIVDLRALEPAASDQGILLLGHTLAGIGGGPFYYDASDITTSDNNGTVIVTPGGARWKRPLEGFVTPEIFGGIEGAADNTTEIQAAVDFCGTSGIRTVFLSQGTWNSTYISKSFSNLKLLGGGGGRPGAANDGGTRLAFIGTTGAFIENGTDDGMPWDDPLYDGPQGLIIEGINVYNASASRTTALNNTAAFYSVGTYGLRDWRGGGLETIDAFFEGFEYSIWGINSDFNKFQSLTQAYSKFGIYLGPRSDQSIFTGLYSFFCDTIGIVDKSSNHKFYDFQSVLCGSATDYGFRVYKGSANIVFNLPWLENFSGVVDCLPFFDIGGVDGYNSNTDSVLDFQVNSPYVAVNTSGGTGPNELISVTKGERIYITVVVGSRGTTATSNLTAYFLIPLGVTATGFDLVYRGVPTSKVLLNNGTGIPNLCMEETGSQWGFSSQTGRFSIKDLNGAAGADEMRITQEGLAGRIQIQCPQYTTGRTVRLDLQRILDDESGMPSSGTYEKGDFVRNINPSVLGGGGSQYIIMGWTRLVTGAAHVLNTNWVEARALTGT